MPVEFADSEGFIYTSLFYPPKHDCVTHKHAWTGKKEKHIYIQENYTDRYILEELEDSKVCYIYFSFLPVQA